MTEARAAQAIRSVPVMRMPRSVDVEITARCNLHCRYCYFFNNPNIEYRDLPTEEWLTFFEELGRRGVMSVTLIGGEPFIREDLPTLIDGLVENRMRYSIAFNGGLIDNGMAAYLAQSGHCDSVQISVDGSCPDTHDARRGKGSFEGAIRGIRTLGDNNLNLDAAKLAVEDLTGKVVAAWRGQKRRKVYCGVAARLIARVVRASHRANRSISRALSPVYHALARCGLLRTILPRPLRPCLIRFGQGERASMMLLLLGRVIGSFDVDHQIRLIRRPFKLFVDESLLPRI
jgi:pyruvate-formate lyase-activating enzyme